MLLADSREEEEDGQCAAAIAHDVITAHREREARSARALFEEVWRNHAEHLFMVCLRKLGDEADAEDALASISITVFEKLPGIQDRILNLRAWLVQVTVNYCVDVQRRRQRHSRLFLEDQPYDEEAHSPPSDTLTPEEHLLERELWQVTHSLISSLPPLLQEAADQHLLKHLSYRQIADNLGISQANVRKRIQKARDLLRQQLYSHLESGSRVAGSPRRL